MPFVAQKLDRPELDLFREFELLPVTAVQPHVYDSEMRRATQLIGWRDPLAMLRRIAEALNERVEIRFVQYDEWQQHYHGPDNNAVAHDTVVGPPRHYQWIAFPEWQRSTISCPP